MRRQDFLAAASASVVVFLFEGIPVAGANLAAGRLGHVNCEVPDAATTGRHAAARQTWPMRLSWMSESCARTHSLGTRRHRSLRKMFAQRRSHAP